MSMEKAMAALNAATPGETQQVSAMPTNMANPGANIEQDTNIQAAQEVKENATDSVKTDADGVVDATKSAAEATTSTKTEEEAPKKEEGPISSKFAALAKKEKAIVKQQADIKAKEAAMAAKEAEIAAREEKIKLSEELWEKDVFKALEAKGLSYAKLTDMMLSGQLVTEKAPEDPVVLAKKEIEAFKEELKKEKEAKELAAKQAEENEAKRKQKELDDAVAAYQAEVTKYTSEHGEDYELLNLYGRHDLVLDTVNEYYDQHKRVLSVKEASDMVEKYLYDEAQKVLNTKKFGKKEEPKKETVAEKIIEKESKPAAQTKTLTNNLTPTMSSVLPAATDSERMKRALNALNNNSR